MGSYIYITAFLITDKKFNSLKLPCGHKNKLKTYEITVFAHENQWKKKG